MLTDSLALALGARHPMTSMCLHNMLWGCNSPQRPVLKRGNLGMATALSQNVQSGEKDEAIPQGESCVRTKAVGCFLLGRIGVGS